MLHISLAAETLWNIGGFPISNAYLTTIVVMAIILVLSFLATRSLSMVPSTPQLIAEAVVGGLYSFFGAIAGKHVKQFFPIIASLFIFILLSNWVGLLPGVGTIGFHHETAEAAQEHAAVGSESETGPSDAEVRKVPQPDDHGGSTVQNTAAETHDESTTVAAAPAEESGTAHAEKPAFTPLLRGPTADLNMTLALAIVAVFAMQYFGFVNLGTHYVSRFISFKDPINFSVGILEIVSDISKIVSFAFRLFGNIFAGEVLLAVMAFLMPFIVPLPFLLMEIFVGLIQALVFSMLSTAFFTVAVSHGEGEHG